MFLSFNNGKKIDLTMLREGIDIGEKNFFKNYDKNNNSIFDAEELAQLQEDLTNAAGEDLVLSEEEAVSFYAKIMNKTVEQVKKLIENEQNGDAYSSINYLFTEQAENEVKAKMQSDVDNAIDIFNNAQGGVITKGCNSLKELFNTQYAGDKVYRQIINKQVSTWILEEAATEEGLTKKEFIERKVQLLLSFLDAENMTGREIDTIRTGLLKSTEAELEEFLNKLINAENNDYTKVVEQTINALNKKATTLREQDIAFKGVDPRSLEAILNGKEGQKKLDFQTVYQFENGVEFNADKIMDAKSKTQTASINLSVYTLIEGLRDELKESAMQVSLALNPSTPESIKEVKLNQLSDNILKALGKWLGGDEQKIAEAIDTYSKGTASIKDGKIVFENKLTGRAGNSAEMMLALANNISNGMFESLDKFLGGKAIEEILAETELANTKAYGIKNPIAIAEKFQESQYRCLGNVKFAVMGTAGVIGALSGGALIPFVSAIAGSALSIGVSALDATTDTKGYTDEDKKAILEELKMNAIFVPTGMATGFASSVMIGKLTKCTGFLRLVAEAGPDAAMSLLAQYAITGEVDLTGEGLSQLMGIAMGIIAGAKVQKSNISRQDLNPRKNPMFNEAISNLKKSNPELYEDFKLLRSKNLLPHTNLMDIDYNPNNSSFTKEYLNNIKIYADAIRKNIDPVDAFIPKFKNATEASSSRKPGEVFAIEGSDKTYIMGNDGPVQLDINRNTYFELFPPLIQASNRQGQMGDCYLVSGLDGAMNTVEGKIALLRKFHQDGEDIVVDLGSYETCFASQKEYLDGAPTQIRFPFGKKRGTAGLSGANGMRLLEEAYTYKETLKEFAIHYGDEISNKELKKLLLELGEFFTGNDVKISKKLRKCLADFYKIAPNLNVKNASELRASIITKISGFEANRQRTTGNGGHTDEALSSFLELSFFDTRKTYPLNNLALLVADTKNKDNIAIYCATKSDGTLKSKQMSGSKIALNHAYRVEYIDLENQIVHIVNPWETSKTVPVSFENFQKWFAVLETIDFTKTKENAQNKNLRELFDKNNISRLDKYGNYLDNEVMLEKYFQILEKNGLQRGNFEDIKYFGDDVFDQSRTLLLQKCPQLKGLCNKSIYNNIVLVHVLTPLIDSPNLGRIVSLIEQNTNNDNTLICLNKVRSEDELIFFLENSNAIVTGLKNRDYDDFEIRKILDEVNISNYNQLKHLWE